MYTRKALDAIAIIIGLWLMISFANMFDSSQSLAMWSGIGLGLAVVVFALWGETNTATGAPEIINVLLGVVLFLSPWLLSFTHVAQAAWNAWISGFVLAALEMLAYQGHAMDDSHHLRA